MKATIKEVPPKPETVSFEYARTHEGIYERLNAQGMYKYLITIIGWSGKCSNIIIHQNGVAENLPSTDMSGQGNPFRKITATVEFSN